MRCDVNAKLSSTQDPAPPPPTATDGTPVTGGTIVTHQANTHINTIHDLKGKKILAGVTKSLTSFQAMAWEMKRAGLDVFNDPAGVSAKGK